MIYRSIPNEISDANNLLEIARDLRKTCPTTSLL